MKERHRNLCGALAAALIAVFAAATGALAGGSWESRPALPVPRSEVASAVAGGRIVVLGGFLDDGSSSRRVDQYDPSARRWNRLPDLPVGVNHPLAAADGNRIYVVGGYANGEPRRQAYVLERGRWLALASLPEPRAAGGAAVVGGRLYVVGGVVARGKLAREMLVYDPASRRWSAASGPTPREHLGVAALGGRIYAVGGRSAGFDTNTDLVEELRPSTMTRSRLLGRSARTSDRRGAGCVRCACMTAMSASRSNGAMPGEALVEHAPQGVDVRSRVDGLTLDLLGCRVVCRADEEPGLRLTGRERVLDDAEVRHVDAFRALLDQDVGGLHVTVDEIAVVRRVEGRGDLLEEEQGAGDGEDVLFGDQRL